MAVKTTSISSLFEKLNVDDIWVPPVPWESIPSESGRTGQCSSSGSCSSHQIYQTSSLSEQSLVRLTMNALEGAESSLISINKFSAMFCSQSADRSSHRISSFWTWSSSTLSLGNLLKSIGEFGCIVFLLYEFVHRFNPYEKFEFDNPLKRNDSECLAWSECQLSLVNQAFAVAVKKVLDGYISALNTIYASVVLRRTLKNRDGGCLVDIGNAGITLLEVYLHTQGLRTQMVALGNICCIYGIALKFSTSDFECLRLEANQEFSNFPRGANLLTYLYAHLKVADPLHSSLLKFLFLQSFEPYYGFVRSWIYEGTIIDPYHDFVVEFSEGAQGRTSVESRTSVAFPSKPVKMRDGVALPCFMEGCLVPLLRAGQQLQVVMELVELCNFFDTSNMSCLEVLPFVDNLSKDFHFSPALTFQKGPLENMALKRSGYYNVMFEKVQNISTTSDFRSWQISEQSKKGFNFSIDLGDQVIVQASSQTVQILYEMSHGRSLKHADSTLDNTSNMPLMDGNLPLAAVVNDASNTREEFSYAEDLLESECSSFDSDEEQNECTQILNTNMQTEPDYLSSLSFSVSSAVKNEMQKSSQTELIHSSESPFFGMYDTQQNSAEAKELNLVGTGRYMWSLDDHVECINSQHKLPSLSPTGGPSKVDGGESSMSMAMTCYKMEVDSINSELQKATMLCGRGSGLFANTLFEGNGRNYQHTDGRCLSTASSDQSRVKYTSKFFCMNPVLSKRNKAGERTSKDCKQPLPYFNFTSVSDPSSFREEEDLTTGSRHQFVAITPSSVDTIATSPKNGSVFKCKEGYGDKILHERTNTLATCMPADLRIENRKESSDASTNGGHSWETQLSCLGNTSDIAAGNCRTISTEVIEMPLDYVIKKCLWEEISLQYSYISKLTIKLLEEGFTLHDHLLALRRYHFMGVADWVDLFITSLWHHKWDVVEADKKILEIQGVLDLSVQRSSCEGDCNRDRLYVYRKGDCKISLPASAKGIHSFHFLGLGYRIDWPISIILTPVALNSYSDIFSFLIQVKLSAFCLTDAWSLLKNLVQLAGRSHSEVPKSAQRRISILTHTRHLLDHFVTTLQQYVQSQLSHVSWCKFLESFKHKVKDMMDLETVHMEYLTDSLQICFLSVEMAPVCSIIQSMLQCAVDLRSCLIAYGLGSVTSGKDCLDDLSRVDIVQVLSIKETFIRNLNDLYLCYLKLPKHGDYGVSRFWDYLNSNNYYSDILVKQYGHKMFPI